MLRAVLSDDDEAHRDAYRAYVKTVLNDDVADILADLPPPPGADAGAAGAAAAAAHSSFTILCMALQQFMAAHGGLPPLGGARDGTNHLSRRSLAPYHDYRRRSSCGLVPKRDESPPRVVPRATDWIRRAAPRRAPPP